LIMMYTPNGDVNSPSKDYEPVGDVCLANGPAIWRQSGCS